MLSPLGDVPDANELFEDVLIAIPAASRFTLNGWHWEILRKTIVALIIPAINFFWQPLQEYGVRAPRVLPEAFTPSAYSFFSHGANLELEHLR